MVGYRRIPDAAPRRDDGHTRSGGPGDRAPERWIVVVSVLLKQTLSGVGHGCDQRQPAAFLAQKVCFAVPEAAGLRKRTGSSGGSDPFSERAKPCGRHPMLCKREKKILQGSGF
jgi:hypothetical protein